MPSGGRVVNPVTFSLNSIQNRPVIYAWNVTGGRKSALEALGFVGMGEKWIRPLEDNDHSLLSLLDWPEVKFSEEMQAILCELQKNSPRIFKDTFKKETLLDYQKEDVDFMLNAGSVLNGLEMGMGKSCESLAVAEALQLPTLIVCPAALRSQWAKEIEKFTDSKIETIIGSRLYWKQNRDVKYTIISYDSLRIKSNVEIAKKIVNGNLMILDEITKIKNFKAQRTKALMKLKPRYTIGLSGTPVENHLGEFYQVFKFINPKTFPYYTTFERMFLITTKIQVKGRTFKKITGAKNTSILKDMIAPNFIRRKRSDALDLPPTSTIIRDVKLTDVQQDNETLFRAAGKIPGLTLKYFIFCMESLISPSILPDDAVSGAIMNIEDELIKYPGSAYAEELADKLMAASDAGTDEKYTPRIKETLELINDAGDNPIIVFSKYKKALRVLSEKIDEEIIWITGDSNVPEEIEKWDREEGRIVFLTTAGAHGLNLQKANMLIFLDKMFNPAWQLQVQGRIHRIGQDKNVLYYDIRSDSNIEKRVNRIIERKEKLSEKVLAKKVMFEEEKI